MNKAKVQMLVDKLIQSYDSGIVDELYREIIRDLLNTAFNVLKDEHLARDAAHDAFLGVLGELRGGHRIIQAPAYFQKAAHNCAINYWRLYQRETTSDTFLAPLTMCEHTDVEDYIERLILSQDFLKLLDVDEQIIVFMYTYRYCTHKEIAARLMRPESTVRNKYARGIKKIRRWAKEQGIIE